ncbi:hypothetical protein D3C73_1438170 [compost metagenome]
MQIACTADLVPFLFGMTHPGSNIIRQQADLQGMVICINVVAFEQQQQRYDIFLRIQRFQQRLQCIIHHGLSERALG